MLTLIFIPPTSSRLLSLYIERKSLRDFHTAISFIFFSVFYVSSLLSLVTRPSNPHRPRIPQHPKNMPATQQLRPITIKHRSAMLNCSGLQTSVMRRDSGRCNCDLQHRPTRVTNSFRR
jgi:hypothetical protein